jgi:hypothetical protein
MIVVSVTELGRNVSVWLDRAEAPVGEGYTPARQAGDRFSRYIALYNASRVAVRLLGGAGTFRPDRQSGLHLPS